MREVKFRTWDKMLSTFFVFTLLDLLSGGLLKIGRFNVQLRDWHLKYLQQFTGLKDCHGDEIYEGDIVKWGDHCSRCTENPVRIAIVEVNPDIQFICLNIDKTFQFGSFAYQDTSHLEIIGNIYEDKNLIKKYAKNDK